jgi:hypothetical protein
MMKKKFKKYKGALPLVFGLVVILVLTLAVPKAVQYIGKASGTPASLVVNYEGVIGTVPQIWRNFAQGGEEPKAMLGEVLPEVRALGPEYIRLDHIYDAFGVVDKVGGQLSYDWSGLDVAVDEILASGAKPFLSLSYMPTAIASSDIVSPPNDWGEWGQVVQATVEHFSGRNNRNISGVIYEVWNEPDLFGGYKTYGDKNYLVMYDVSARAAMRAKNTNSFEIGGPAMTALYKNWLERLIKYASKNNLRLDFLSWHRYDYGMDVFERDAKQADKWSESIPAFLDLKFYVTEWGIDSENSPAYDNKLSAIHALAATRVMMGRVDRAFMFEIKDGPGEEKYWARWGLLTHEKFGEPEKKPRYRAVMFLNSLFPFRVSLAGEGGWVKGIASMNEAGGLKVLVVNYDPNGKHTENVPVSFENLPKGNFSYKRHDFMGGSTSTKVATTSASFQTTEYMNVNSAMILELEF